MVLKFYFTDYVENRFKLQIFDGKGKGVIKIIGI